MKNTFAKHLFIFFGLIGSFGLRQALALGANKPFDAQVYAGHYQVIECTFDPEYYEYNTAPKIETAEIEYRNQSNSLILTTNIDDYNYLFEHINEGQIKNEYRAEGNCYTDTVKTRASANKISTVSKSVTRFMCMPLLGQSGQRKSSLQKLSDGTLLLHSKGILHWEHRCSLRKVL